MAGTGIMRVTLCLGWLSLAVAQAQSSSSSSSSSFSSSSSLSTSSSVSSNTTQVSNSSLSSSHIPTSRASSSSSTILNDRLAKTTSTFLSASSSSASASTSLSATLALPTAVNGTSTFGIAPNTTAAVAYVNPWAGNFSQPAPLHGTGSNYALQCQNAYFSYTSINSDYLTVTDSTFLLTSVIRSTTVYVVHTSYTTSFYTLCDGHPRVITSMPTATETTTLLPSTTIILAKGISAVKYPDPNCTVSWDDCRGLWSRYESASSVYKSASFAKANTVVSLGAKGDFWVVSGTTTTFPTPFPSTISLGNEQISKAIARPPKPSTNYIIVTTPPPGGIFWFDGYTMTPGGPPVTIEHTIDFTNTPYTPHCRTEQPTCTAGARCQIGGDKVQIFWFPPQTNVSRDMCATAPTGAVTSRPPTNFTWTPITTGPYAVMDGNTMYSGNVYVSLNRINAECNWSGTSVEVGAEHGGEILTMAPSELFSQRAYPITTGKHSGMIDFEPYAYQFNFNDLISPYPWVAWEATPDCVIDKCNYINGSYNPWIAVPEAIRRLDPKWSTCDLSLYGLYDPPRALSSIGNIFASITSNDPQPPPTPGQSVPQSEAQPTKPPQPSQKPPPPPSPPSPPPPPPPVNRPTPPSDPNDPKPPQNPGTPGNPNNNPGQPPAQPGRTNKPLPPPPTTIATIGHTPVVIDPAHPTNPVVGTTSLAPGAPPITVGHGTTISMTDPGHIIVSAPGAPAPSTINVPQPNPAKPTAGVVISLPNGSTMTATAIPGPSGSSLIVSGTMFTPGGPPITLPNGVVLSEGPSGTGIVVIDPSSGTTSTLAISGVPGIGNAPQPTSGVVLTLPNGDVVTATAIPGPHGSSIIVSGTTFSVGGAPITLPNGVVLSEAPSGTGIVVIDPATGATSTIPFSSVSGLITDVVPTPHPTPGAVVTIGGRVYTVVEENGTMMIPELGVTLSRGGPATTINGTVISEAGTGVVVGTTTTVPFSTVEVTPSGGDATGAATGAAARGLSGEMLFGKEWWMGFWVFGAMVLGGGVMLL
ncbi:hypothetical protein EJ04DRAFT_550220 [Polyplosphaeria fusca]|uniref:Uncharacterized protein n=1 Tax=Polyplosphaeria fusca TaxID=682080 RepID=A0A9P4V665_9PLEO|nr:hypothetical protein EJ04DRAFT_550220 [Polyplosphaeria fusca]